MELFGVYMTDVVAAMLIGETVLAVLLVLAVILAKTHRGTNHHWLMLAVFVLDSAVFKPMMYSRALSGAFGNFPFEGTQVLPHMLLSLAVLIAGIGTILFGFRYRVKRDGKMFMPPTGQVHRWLGRAFVTAWFASYAVGMYIFSQVWL